MISAYIDLYRLISARISMISVKTPGICMDMIQQDHIGMGIVIDMIYSDHIGIGMVVSVEPYTSRNSFQEEGDAFWHF